MYIYEWVSYLYVFYVFLTFFIAKSVNGITVNLKLIMVGAMFCSNRAVYVVGCTVEFFNLESCVRGLLLSPK